MIHPMFADTYVPLWCKSNYSFLEGASHPEELIEQAARLGIRSLALCDRDGVYGAVRAYVKARELGVHLIIGSEITIDDGSTIVLLTQNSEGYSSLCQLISAGRLRSPKGESSVSWQEVCERSKGLIALWGGGRSLIAGKTDPLFVARSLREAFGDRFYALVARHRRPEEAAQEKRLRERATLYGIPTVAGTEVLYHVSERRDLQDVLTCIRHGVTLATAGRLTKPNAEHNLKTPYAFRTLFEDDTVSVTRTETVAKQCTFSLAEIRYRYPSEKLPGGTTSAEWLRHLTFEGAKERYFRLAGRPGLPARAAHRAPPVKHGGGASASANGFSRRALVPRHNSPRGNRLAGGVPTGVAEQLEKELAVITELEYEGYFLTMWEIVQFCRRKGILCQGRGSAANSAVCYCLGITAVDPVQMGLLFERFLSRERAEPPDIDLDIEHNRREEVIQHVYQKYGRTHAAMVANFVRYRSRSAVREVGKVLEVPDTTLDRVAKLLSHYDDISNATLGEAGFDAENQTHQHLARLAAEIQDFPRHLSIHPGGFLLGHKPVHELVPIENATMPDRTVIQWDKEDIESLGLFKVDLLGLGMLTVLNRSFDLIAAHCGRQLNMATVPDDDPPTYQMIRRADTVGVFQVESRAQMAMLPRLKPRTYYDLVIEVSIVRPGPITGGMVHPYLRRRNGEEEVDYPHPSLEPVLKKTLGIPLFQEQVMRLAVVAADYTPGEADQLRRDMAAWRRTGRLERHRERLITRMEAKGITTEFAERVFDQIKGFGDYGFPESHAASFAYIAYVSAWLKCRYPTVFLCALLNAQPMGFYTPATLIDDAKRHGVVVLPVDVQKSEWDCTMELCASRPTDGVAGEKRTVRSPGHARERPDAREAADFGYAIRVGLRYVKGLREDSGERILSARTKGLFHSVADLTARTRCEEGALTRLAEAGAFESIEYHRRNVLWEVRGETHGQRHEKKRGEDDAAAPGPRLPLEEHETKVSFAPLDSFETVSWDYVATGHSPRGHLLASLRSELRAMGLPDAKTVWSKKNGSLVRYAGIVINRQRPGTAKGVVFMTLEDETGFVNVIIWRNVFLQYEIIAKTVPFLGVTGRLQSESGVTHLVAESLWEPGTKQKPRRRRSRDFH